MERARRTTAQPQQTINSTSNTNNTTSNNSTALNNTTGGTSSLIEIPFSSILSSKRSEEGLVAKWDFADLQDSVGDLDLSVVGDGSTLLPPQGVQFSGGGHLANSETQALSTALRNSNAFSVELWLQPSLVIQENATLVALVSKSQGRNFSLSQDKMSSLPKFEQTTRVSSGIEPTAKSHWKLAMLFVFDLLMLSGLTTAQTPKYG